MYKCPKCGTEFEGKFCPKCGTGIQPAKRCPNCKVVLNVNAKFCPNCGFSFESKTMPVQQKQKGAAAVWVSKHKIAVIISTIVLIAAIVLLSLIPTFIKASVNGTYYAYRASTDTLDSEDYITLKTGKWTDSEGFGGTYKVSNGTITLKVDMFGEEMEFAKGKVENGMLSYEEFGEKTVYLTRKHKHRYGEWTDKDELTCTQDKTRVHSCACGKEEKEVVTAAKGHQGKWTITKEATCADYGERETHCTVCDKDVFEYIQKLPHDLSLDADETSHYQICSMCKQKFDSQEHEGNDECSVCHYPLTYTKELEFSLNSDNESYCVTGIGKMDSKFVRIPDTYQNLPVTSIGRDAFDGCSWLTSIIIPDSVKKIGYGAFSRCSGLTSITIPDSVTSIGIYAFYGCSGLTSITIPENIINVGEKILSGCIGLKTIYWNAIDCTMEYSNGAYREGIINVFDDIDSLNIIIGKNVKNIPDYAFAYCPGLTNITIPDNVESIGYRTFWRSDLKTIEIGSGLTSVISFFQCGQLESIIVAEGNATYASQGGILYNKAKTKIIFVPEAIAGSLTIPDSMTSIGDSAFSGCSGLTSITIPDSVTSIGMWALRNCSGLTSITIPDSMTSIGNSAFDGCSGLTSVHIKDLAKWCNISFVSASSNPLYYAHNLYLNGELITELIIPDSVTSIGGYAFYGCSGLTNITVAEDNEHLKSVNNCILSKDGKELILGCKNSIIPDSVSSIGDYAFSGCSGLTSITIPDSVTSIGNSAFYGCSGLTTINIPDSVTSIGKGAFYGCSKLTSITIPDSVTSIGNSAFDGCSKLTSINFTGSMAQWKAIEKGNYWNYGTGDYIVTCTDGKLDKDGNVITE